MNEAIFFLQTLIIIGFAWKAYKLGPNGLTAWVAIQALIANLFVLKQITLFGFEVTASDAFAIGSLLGLNILQEQYGQEEAKKATWICFFFMFFFALVSQVHLLFKPSVYDTTQEAFQMILSPAPRLLIASLSVFFIVQQIDVRFFTFLKEKLPESSFALRTTIALVVSQFLDTFLFSFAGLYGLVASITDVIVISFMLKLTIILFFSSFAKWVKA